MHLIQNVILFCSALLLWTACATKESRNESLQHVLQTVDTNPKEALELLERIPDPESLDKNNYMRYVTTLTQARYMNNQDITGDSLILKTQAYFVGKQDLEMAARASFYAAHYCREKQKMDKELEYFLLANDYARQAGNHLFSAKSLQWIGSCYYNIDELDSAKVYYRQALELYNTKVDAALSRLDLIYMLGRTHRELLQFDQAFSCFNEGLEIAHRLNNELYEARFTHHKGIVLRETKDYPQAKVHFDLALSKKPESEDSLRIYLSYARLYKVTNHPDSTLYYLERVKNRISEITYPYTRRLVYQELVLYYKKEGNLHEMERFSNLQNQEELLIQKMKNEAKLQAANERFEQYKRDTKTTFAQYNNAFKITLIVVTALLFLLLIYGVEKRRLKKAYSHLRQQQTFHKLDLQHILLGGLRSIAKSMDHLRGKDSEATVPISEQLQTLREDFTTHLADSAANMLEQFPNGTNALPELSSEDLCILQMVQLKIPEELINRMLGHEHRSTDYILIRKGQIRNILIQAGVKEREIKILFPQQ